MIAALLLACAIQAANPPQVGDAAPSFALADADGQLHSSSTLTPAILNFWASWCAPCIDELPQLNALAARTGLRVIAINVDREDGPPRGIVNRLGLTLPVLYDPKNEVIRAFSPPGLPTTYVIDQAGVIRNVHSGRLDADDMPTLEAELRAAESPP